MRRTLPTALLCSAALLLLVGCTCNGARTAGSDKVYLPLFDGKTLDGWRSPDMSFWRVEDGAITGEVTAGRKPPENNFIVWQGGEVDDFELQFKFRITGAKANSGMQFRSEVKE